MKSIENKGAGNYTSLQWSLTHVARISSHVSRVGMYLAVLRIIEARELEERKRVKRHTGKGRANRLTWVTTGRPAMWHGPCSYNSSGDSYKERRASGDTAERGGAPTADTGQTQSTNICGHKGEERACDRSAAPRAQEARVKAESWSTSVSGSSPVHCSCRKTARTPCAKTMTRSMSRREHAPEPQGPAPGKRKGTTPPKDSRLLATSAGSAVPAP